MNTTMKIGASTCYGVINKPVIESVNELEKAGFDAIEISYEYNNILTAEEVKILKSRNKILFSESLVWELKKDYDENGINEMLKLLFINNILVCFNA